MYAPVKIGSRIRKSECITAVSVFACAGEGTAAESIEVDRVSTMPATTCRKCRRVGFMAASLARLAERHPLRREWKNVTRPPAGFPGQLQQAARLLGKAGLLQPLVELLQGFLKRRVLVGNFVQVDFLYAVQGIAGQGAAKFLQGGVGICCMTGKRKRTRQMCLVVPNRSFRDRFSKPDNCLVVVSHREIRAPQHPIKYTDTGIARTKSYRLQRQCRRFLRASRQDELIGLLCVAEGKIGIERERPVKSVQGPLMISLCATNEAIIHMVHGKRGIEAKCLLQRVLRLLQQILACLGILCGFIPAI